jgi:hypothetical protein
MDEESHPAAKEPTAGDFRLDTFAGCVIKTDAHIMRADKERKVIGHSVSFFIKTQFALLDARVKQIDVAEKAVDKGIRRMFVDTFRAAHLFDFSLVEYHDRIGNFEGFFLVVCNKDAGDMNLIAVKLRKRTGLLTLLS